MLEAGEGDRNTTLTKAIKVIMFVTSNWECNFFDKIDESSTIIIYFHLFAHQVFLTIARKFDIFIHVPCTVYIFHVMYSL